ncbi:hypothetical protein A2U01_0066614 [Trifolium medium]|uniref:Uncharacterized protein n=1 Tax=Trifolium medium TaxID=97028 RepID=A0A392SBV6_9FABA|nr:hypothetical protein [Trifolium medium]
MAATPWADSVTSILSRRAAIAVVAAAIDNRDINAKVNVELCVALEHSKYHSNYLPHGIYDHAKYDA